jgi:hypothetical protein
MSSLSCCVVPVLPDWYYLVPRVRRVSGKIPIVSNLVQIERLGDRWRFVCPYGSMLFHLHTDKSRCVGEDTELLWPTKTIVGDRTTITTYRCDANIGIGRYTIVAKVCSFKDATSVEFHVAIFNQEIEDSILHAERTVFSL